MADFDTLHLRLARRMRDPVATSATDGKVLTSANRTDYLNNAMRWFQNVVVTVVGRDKAREKLQSQVSTQALTFAGAGIAVGSSYNNIPLAVTKTGSTNLYKFHPRREELVADVNPNMPYAFTIEADTIYVYESGTLLASGAGFLYFLNKDEGAVSGSILLAETFWDVVVDIAASFAWADLAQGEQAKNFMQRATDILKLLL